MLTRIRGFHGTVVYEFVCVMATIMRRPTLPSAPCHHTNTLKADQWALLIIFVQLVSFFLHGWGGGENKGSSHLTSPHVLLRCPLACLNSAPWCLICITTFAPPSLCLCSSSSARFHNRGVNDRGALSITPTSSGKLFSSPAVFLHVMLFTLRTPVSCLSSLLSPISWYRVIWFPKFLRSEVTEMSEFRGSSASLPFSQWLISSYLDRRV